MSTDAAPKMPLKVALDILDRADQAEASTCPDRQTMIEAMLALDTGHTPAVIESAVDAHRAAKPSQMTPKGFRAWGWRRPATWKQVERAERRSSSSKDMGATIMVGIASLSGMTMLSWVAYLGFFTPQGGHGGAWEHAGAALIAGVLAFVFGMIPGLLISGVFECWKQSQARYGRVAVDAKELLVYCKEPACRSYLRAVRDSSLPCFLGGDVERLRALTKEAHTDKIREKNASLQKQIMAVQTAMLDEVDTIPLAT